MPAPSTGIPVPTGALDQYRADLRALQKEQKAVDREMAKSAKKGVEISKDLLDRKKKIDAAIAKQQEQVKRFETAIKRKEINTKAEASRAGAGGLSAWQKSAQGVMMLRHAGREVKRFDSAFHKLRAGGPDIDKEEAVGEMLALASHIPGPVGMAARAMRLALQAVMAIQISLKEERRGYREAKRALQGGVPVEDPDDIKRRDSKGVEKKLSYIDPEYKLNPAQASKALGGGIDPAELRERLARQIRNENAGLLRTALMGAPLIGGYVQKGGKLIGIDDEAKINELVDAALNKKIPELMARAKERAEHGDLRGAQRDLNEIKRIEPGLAPAASAEGLFQDVQDRRNYATRKSIEQMGIRHIDGRDE